MRPWYLAPITVLSSSRSIEDFINCLATTTSGPTPVCIELTPKRAQSEKWPSEKKLISPDTHRLELNAAKEETGRMQKPQQWLGNVSQRCRKNAVNTHFCTAGKRFIINTIRAFFDEKAHTPTPFSLQNRVNNGSSTVQKSFQPLEIKIPS